MNRLASIDVLRGFIMALMALDHASAFIARVHFTEIWGVGFKEYPSIAWCFTRFVSHLCAPGFFFLMGISMVLFAKKQQLRFWSNIKIQMYFVKRAWVILLLMFLVELPAWALGMFFNEVRSTTNLPGLLEGSFLIPTSVLFGLSISMLSSAFLWRFNSIFLSLLVIGSFALSGLYISASNPAKAFHVFEHIFLVPGMSDGILVLYPLLPWVGVTALGMIWAKLYTQYPSKIYAYTLYSGIICITSFFILRFLSFGNFQFNTFTNGIDFFTLIKYPPGIPFILCTIGINLVLLALFNKLTTVFSLKLLRIFGQTAMFFYLLHLYVYAVLGIAFPRGSNIITLYALWLFGLSILYYVCQFYLQFKQQKPPNSLWRML